VLFAKGSFVGRVTVTTAVGEEVLRMACRIAARTDQEQKALENLAEKLDMYKNPPVEWIGRVRKTRLVSVKEPIA